MGKKSLSQAAAIAGVSHQTVARWVKTGKLKAEYHEIAGMIVKLVNVDEVIALSREIRRGRPPKGGRGNLRDEE